ncbi:MAG TPA: XdhC family protein [Nocardioidaceae bacterium]|nr:XdhC family protein [Nocardioidaceae bacterium]
MTEHPNTDPDRGPGHGATLLVVGDGEVAGALEAMSRTLGWSPVVVNTAADAEAQVGTSDAVVVLSHHDGVDGPALAAALAADRPYVGAMGSRRTQARRRAWMLENGVAEERVDSIHGPAGLAIGADTPGEIAVAILAEIIGVRRGSVGGSLRDRSGPIHPDLEPGTAECPAG